MSTPSTPHVIKICYTHGSHMDTRRVHMTCSPTHTPYQQLLSFLETQYGQQPYQLKYRDDEGDMCSIGSSAELTEAFRVYTGKVLKLEVTVKVAPSTSTSTSTSTPTSTPTSTAAPISTPAPFNTSHSTAPTPLSTCSIATDLTDHVIALDEFEDEIKHHHVDHISTTTTPVVSIRPPVPAPVPTPAPSVAPVSTTSTTSVPYVLPPNIILTTFDPNAATSTFSIQTVYGFSDWSGTYTFAPFASPLGGSNTGVISFGGVNGPNMYRTCDRDHCPFWYRNELYIFATYEYYIDNPTSAPFVIYKVNPVTKTIQFHHFVQCGIIVASDAKGTTFNNAREIWRPKPFLNQGRVQVILTAFWDWTDVTLPMNTIIGEMTDDLREMHYYSVICNTIFPSNALSNKSNQLSARFIDAEPIIDNRGIFLGFLLKDEIWERANRNNGGVGIWNRITWANPDGTFNKQITSMNSLMEPDNPNTQLDVEGIRVKQNLDNATWTTWFQSIHTYKIYTAQLDSTFELIKNTVVRVNTPFSGMGSTCRVPDLSSLTR